MNILDCIFVCRVRWLCCSTVNGASKRTLIRTNDNKKVSHQRRSPSADCFNECEKYDEKLFQMEKLIYFHGGHEIFGSSSFGNTNNIKEICCGVAHFFSLAGCSVQCHREFVTHKILLSRSWCVAFAPDPERFIGKCSTKRKVFFVIYSKSIELIKNGCKGIRIQGINHDVECDRVRLRHGSPLFIYFKLE